MIIKIKVKPNSSKQEIVKINEDEYSVYLKEKAERNKANIELMNLLARYFKVPVSKIFIRGRTSRQKLVEVKE